MAHDLVVVGGGPGGYATAFRAAARGLDVALVESDKVGGTCLHRGCIPSKAILHVAEVLEEVERADVLGIKVIHDGIDGDGLAAFRQGVVDNLHKGLAHLVKQRTTMHAGRGRLLDAGTVEVTGPDGSVTRVEGRHVVIATGSVPRGLPGIDIDGDVVQTSDEALQFRQPPGREEAARAVGFLGFGFYPRSGFMHIDLGPARQWGERFPVRATAFAAEAPPAREVLAESRTMKGSGAAGVATIGAAGVEVAQNVLAETQSAILPLVPHLDTLRWVFIAVALAGITVAIYARIDDRKRGRR